MNIRRLTSALLHIIRRVVRGRRLARRTPGSARGKILIAPDFDAPLPKDAGFD